MPALLLFVVHFTSLVFLLYHASQVRLVVLCGLMLDRASAQTGIDKDTADTATDNLFADIECPLPFNEALCASGRGDHALNLLCK